MVMRMKHDYQKCPHVNTPPPHTHTHADTPLQTLKLQQPKDPLCGTMSSQKKVIGLKDTLVQYYDPPTKLITRVDVR